MSWINITLHKSLPPVFVGILCPHDMAAVVAGATAPGVVFQVSV